MRILAGDIGGTKTYLSLFERFDGGFREIRSARYRSADYPSLAPMVRDFLGHDVEPLARAGFGVAGPVVDGNCTATNLPWSLVGSELSAELRAPVSMVNDFYAVALGITCLRPEDVRVLQDAPADPHGLIAIIGAGTGLGKATMQHGAAGVTVSPSEGGHREFGPRNADEIGFLRFLLERMPRAPYDRVVSGQGILLMYQYLVATGQAELPETRARLELEDPGAVIGGNALAGTDPLCVRAVEAFISLYGAEAGNFALDTLPGGGLYVAGGIAPRLLPLIERGAFMEAFNDKGRMGRLTREVRVQVITQPRVGLLGAARAALGKDTVDAIVLSDG